MGSFTIHSDKELISVSAAYFNRYYKINLLDSVYEKLPTFIIGGEIDDNCNSKEEYIANIRKASGLYVDI